MAQYYWRKYAHTPYRASSNSTPSGQWPRFSWPFIGKMRWRDYTDFEEEVFRAVGCSFKKEMPPHVEASTKNIKNMEITMIPNP
eukprot:gene12690-3719_t